MEEKETVGIIRKVILWIGSKQVEFVQIESQLKDVTSFTFFQEIPQQNPEKFRLFQWMTILKNKTKQINQIKFLIKIYM
jgi:hypothetical protein